MNTDLREKAKKDFEKVDEQCCFWKIIKNVRKHRNIELTTTEKGRNCLVSKPSYHTTKFFTESLSAIDMKKQRYLCSLFRTFKTRIKENINL